jgi:hypothetical protein
MAVLIEAEFPGVTAQQYDAVDQRAGTRSGRPVEGLLCHNAVVTDEGLRVIDVWESPEAFQAYFTQRLQPILAEQDFPDPSSPPRFSNVHHHYRSAELASP